MRMDSSIRLNLTSIVRDLGAAGVRYVLTGSVAAVAYGAPVEPRDLDIAPDLEPENLVRFHTCWGSQHGPHMDDIELKYIIDLILKIKAECYSVEAANPQHDHDWHVFETVKLPEGKSYMPGVVSHVSNTIEHPQLVADRLIRYARLMGKEQVIAGTDCGMGSRVGHPEVCWAKFNAMVEGAKLATKELWGR